MREESIVDAINEAAKEKVPAPSEGFVRRKVAAQINKARRIHNKILTKVRRRNQKRIAKAQKLATILRRAGETAVSPEIRAVARIAHAPIPRALQGQVKQAARTFDRAQEAKIRAAKVRKSLEIKGAQ